MMGADLGAFTGDVEAAREREQRREHEHGGGLPRSVGAEEAIDLAG